MRKLNVWELEYQPDSVNFEMKYPDYGWRVRRYVDGDWEYYGTEIKGFNEPLRYSYKDAIEEVNSLNHTLLLKEIAESLSVIAKK